MIQPGKYKATVSNYALRVSQHGDPMATICFTVTDNAQSRHSVYWLGSFKEGRGRQITIESLLVCGLKGNDPLLIAGGLDSGALDTSNEVQVEVIHEVSTKDGKTYPKVQWVNEIGGNRFRDAVPHKEAVQRFAGLNLAADVAQIRNDKGYRNGANQNNVRAPQPIKNDNLSDIPF